MSGAPGHTLPEQCPLPGPTSTYHTVSSSSASAWQVWSTPNQRAVGKQKKEKKIGFGLTVKEQKAPRCAEAKRIMYGYPCLKPAKIILILYTMIKNSVTSIHSCGWKPTESIVNNNNVNVFCYVFLYQLNASHDNNKKKKSFYIHKVSIRNSHMVVAKNIDGSQS